jgi:hypothetical protein
MKKIALLVFVLTVILSLSGCHVLLTPSESRMDCSELRLELEKSLNDIEYKRSNDEPVSKRLIRKRDRLTKYYNKKNCSAYE